jgi:hypothetical protein
MGAMGSERELQPLLEALKSVAVAFKESGIYHAIRMRAAV